MLIILWKRGEIAPEEQFLLLSTVFCYLMLDFCVKTGMRFSLQDKLLFKIIEVEILHFFSGNFSPSELPQVYSIVILILLEVRCFDSKAIPKILICLKSGSRVLGCF